MGGLRKTLKLCCCNWKDGWVQSQRCSIFLIFYFICFDQGLLLLEFLKAAEHKESVAIPNLVHEKLGNCTW